MSHTTETGQPSGRLERSASELVKQMSEQVSTLVRDELKLAEQEMTRKGKQAGIAAMAGKSRLQQATPPVPQKAVHSVKTDVAEIKERARR